MADPFDLSPHGWRTELRATLALAVPLAGANLIQMAVYAVDVVFVARLGPVALSASALSVSVFGLFMWSMTGLCGAAAPLIAAELGRGGPAVREVRRTTRMALWLAVLSGVLVMLVCLGGERFMLLTGQPPKVAALAGPFLAVLSLSAIPALLSAVLRVFVSTMGRAQIATWITALALVVNIIGNYALVFGNLGAPELGLQGSAWSSLITTMIMLAAYMWVIFADRRLRRYYLFGRLWRSDWVRFFDLLRIGTPIALTIVAEAGLFSGAAFLMGRIGEAQLAAHTVALQFAALAFQIPFGIAQAATIRVGLFYGARDHAGIALAGRTAIALGIGFMGVTALAIMAAPHFILRAYLDPSLPANTEVIGHAVQFLLVAAAFQLFDGAQAVGAGTLRGLQDTRVPMAIAMFGYWAVGFSVAIGLGFYTPLEGLGVWLGLMAGLVTAAALLLWRWRARARLGLLPA